MAIGRKWVVGLLVVKALEAIVLLLLFVPSAKAADGQPVATETPEAVRAAIEAESDPELQAVMQELLETGELDQYLAERELAAGIPSEGPVQTGGLPELIGPPVDGGTGGGSLPPGARRELEELFQQGTGDPNSQTDRELREQAEKILERYGIEPPEAWEHEGDWKDQGEGMVAPREAFERWLEGPEAQGLDQQTIDRYQEAAEHYQETFERGEMAVEPREAFERWVETEGQDVDHETVEQYREEAEHYQAEFDRYQETVEAPQYEAPQYEAPQYEASESHYEAPPSQYEAPHDEQPSASYEGAPQP